MPEADGKTTRTNDAAAGGRKENRMMAMLWAQQIMLGKKTFAQAPRLLKEQVKAILLGSGMDELAAE